MKYYPVQLRDSIGNLHERKNICLKEIAELSAAYAQAKGEERLKLKKVLAEMKANRHNHAYTLQLEDFRRKEKQFRSELRQKRRSLLQNSSFEHYKLKKLDLQLLEAEAERSFYAPYVELCYDAELAHRCAELKCEHLPRTIARLLLLDVDIKRTEQALAAAEASDRSALQAELQAYKVKRSTQGKLNLRELKQKYRSGLISLKALRNESKMIKRSQSEDIAMFALRDPALCLQEELDSLLHQRKIEPGGRQRVLDSDISDVRRKTPQEVGSRFIIWPWLGLLIPGLAQLFNRQYQKALLFLTGTFFMYAVAIPYALGYGNYQGSGIAGLISLAQGGKRIERSIIFMIEGIIAIFLVIFALFLLYCAARDAYVVKRAQHKGVRPLNWFESKEQIMEKGFPYLVSTPALIIIVFIILVPVVTTILISCTNMDPKHQSKFVWYGLENYKTVALGQGVAGKAFWLILGWTVVWTLCASSLAIVIGFFLALLVNQDRIKGKRIWRTIYLLPWAVPAFISIMFFSIMLAPNGPLTELLSNLVGQTLNIKNDTLLTRTALVFMQSWLGSAYIFLLCTGVLQGIPSDLYEAAEIDGATGIQKTLHLTIPLVLFQIAPLLVTQYTFNFNNYSIIALFNDGGPFVPSLYGNLAGSSDILISYIFKLTIKNEYQALGAAITIVISAFLMLVSYLGFRRTKAFQK